MKLGSHDVFLAEVKFEFIDEDVWYKFNQAVASIKGWQLPKQHEQKTRKRAK